MEGADLSVLEQHPSKATPLELIRKMLDINPTNRPSIHHCLEQVSLWNVLTEFGKHARRDEQFEGVASYRSEVQAQMLQITAGLRQHLGERAVSE